MYLGFGFALNSGVDFQEPKVEKVVPRSLVRWRERCVCLAAQAFPPPSVTSLRKGAQLSIPSVNVHTE